MSSPFAIPGIEAGGTDFVRGYRQVEAELLALPEGELLPVNIDVPSAVATVLGALPRLRALRDEVARLPGFDLQRFDRLVLYAEALGHAHAVQRAAVRRKSPAARIAARLAKLHSMLHADATALALRGALPEASVKRLGRGAGHKNLAFDVAGLVSLLREHWTAIGNRTAVQPSELDEAERLAADLVTAVGCRERASSPIKDSRIVRQRAFTLLARAYDDARHAVLFLRRHDGDADAIAPSLWAGRGGRGRKPGSPSTPSAQGAGGAESAGSGGVRPLGPLFHAEQRAAVHHEADR